MHDQPQQPNDGGRSGASRERGDQAGNKLLVSSPKLVMWAATALRGAMAIYNLLEYSCARNRGRPLSSLLENNYCVGLIGFLDLYSKHAREPKLTLVSDRPTLRTKKCCRLRNRPLRLLWDE